MNRPSQPETRKTRRSGYFARVPPALWAILLLSVFGPTSALAASPATITSYEIPGAVSVSMSGIDAAGLIVGSYLDSNRVSHGFTRDAAGVLTIIDAPGAGTATGQGTYTAGVSNGGQIAGSYADSGGREHGFWLGPSGRFVIFDAPDSDETFASGINDSGQVSGFYYYDGFPAGPFGFIWTDGSPALTFEPANTLYLYSARINSYGEVAGYFENTLGKSRLYYRDANGNITTFSPSPGPVSGDIYVAAINDSGTIVGYFNYQNGAAQGFVREGSSITQVSIAGAVTTWVLGVNASGTLVGYYTDTNGAYHGFIQDRLGNVTLIDISHAGTGVNQGTFAASINASGEVAGYFIGSLGNVHGFLWRQ